MSDIKKYLVKPTDSIRKVLNILNSVAPTTIAFVVDENNVLLGSVTDGDVRRGLIKGYELDQPIHDIIHKQPFSLTSKDKTPQNFNNLLAKRITMIPIVDDQNRLLDIINLENYFSLLPLEAIIMAGGKGTRLRPLTENTPKPLLKIGDKPIIEHLIDRLIKFGIQKIHISLNYLGEQIENYFGNGSSKNVEFNYIYEKEFFGTAGSLILGNQEFESEDIIFMNSDLLTNIDFADMYEDFKANQGDMIVATVPYDVQVPYGVIEMENNTIAALKEKPTYTYYSNAGIYMLKKAHLQSIPKNTYFDATDLIENLIQNDKKVLNYPIRNYWLDIGKPEDFKKAQEDIKHIKVN